MPHPMWPKGCPREPDRGSGGLGCAPPPTLARNAHQKNGAKKSRPQSPWRRFYAKRSQMMISGLAVGFENFCRRRLYGRASRALSPPRLAAGAGGRIAETLKNFYVLGVFGGVSLRLFFGSRTPAFQALVSFLRLAPASLARAS